MPSLRAIMRPKSGLTSPATLEPVLLARAGPGKRLGAGEQGLGGDAAPVETGAADEVVLDQRDRGAVARGAQRGHVAARAAADDDDPDGVRRARLRLIGHLTTPPAIGHAGHVEDLGDDLLFADGHDVHAVADLVVAQEGDVPGRDLHALLQLVFLGHAAQLLEQGVRHEDARDGAVHVLGHAQTGEHHEPGHHLDVGARGDLPRLLHEALEVVHVVDGLGLEEVGPGLDLAGELVHLRLERVGLGGHHGAHEEVGGSVELRCPPSRCRRSSSCSTG